MKIFSIAFAVSLVDCAVGRGDAYLTDRPAYAGVWVNTFGKPYDLTDHTSFLAGEADRQRWKSFETAQGVFDFSSLDTALTRCRDRGYYYYAEVWTGENAPSWIYSQGVSRS